MSNSSGPSVALVTKELEKRRDEALTTSQKESPNNKLFGLASVAELSDEKTNSEAEGNDRDTISVDTKSKELSHRCASASSRSDLSERHEDEDNPFATRRPH